MTFDVISGELCLPARRAEDYKLVPQNCEPTNMRGGRGGGAGAGARVRDVNTMSAMFLHRLAREQVCNVKQPKWILKIYCWIRIFSRAISMSQNTARKNLHK